MTAQKARQLLGVSAAASKSEVRAAWRRAAKAAHPDHGGDARRFREIAEAYRLLRQVPAAFTPRVIRRDDLWLTVKVAPRILADGGRVELDTPLGRRVVWVSRKAGARRMLRLPDQSLLVRLEAETVTEGPARSQLRRFTAAWAA